MSLLCMSLSACSTLESLISKPSRDPSGRNEYYEDKEVVTSTADLMDLGVADYVRMQRGPCFGACPEYIVVIGKDGWVRYKGIRHVAVTGMQEKQINRSRIQGIDHALARLQIMQSANAYVPGDKNCPRVTTDMPTVELQVVGPGGGIKRIKHYTGCQDAPAALKTFEDLIDRIADTAEWTGAKPAVK